MRKLFGVLAISTLALGATAAVAENTVSEHKAELQRLWDSSRTRAASPGNLLARVFGRIEFRFVNPGTAEVGSNYGQNLRGGVRHGNGAWAGNFHAGRVHPPAGR